jgi:uncharacterized protein (TIGR02757 family)
VERRRPVRRREILRSRLDELAATFDVSTISPDPLEVVREFSDSRDREVAGLVAAAFAYGRAELIVANLRSIFAAMGPSPHEYLTRDFSRDEAMRRFERFSYRFHRTADLVALLSAISASLEQHGSLGALFRAGCEKSDSDIAPALDAFVTALRNQAGAPMSNLLSAPSDGSACKRMNLFLRWMVRTTEPDLAIWSFADPAKLVIPLDTHVHRISRFLGLTERKAADWKTAREVTDALARLDPQDPVRYDFAICRLGILALCSRAVKPEQCRVCLLNDVCRFPAKGVAEKEVAAVGGRL